MVKQANASRLSRLFNVAGFIVDGYNGFAIMLRINNLSIYH